MVRKQLRNCSTFNPARPPGDGYGGRVGNSTDGRADGASRIFLRPIGSLHPLGMAALAGASGC